MRTPSQHLPILALPAATALITLLCTPQDHVVSPRDLPPSHSLAYPI